jgi:hypothetical protein
VGSPGALACLTARGWRGRWGADAARSSRRAKAVDFLSGRRRRRHQQPARSAACLDRLTGTQAGRRPPASSWRGRGRAVGACWFAGKLRSRAGPGPGATVAEAADPYASGYATPYGGHPRTPSPSGGRITAGHAPLGGSGAAAPSGALRAIDSYGAAAFLADLRSAPPAAAIPACPGRNAKWCCMSRRCSPNAALRSMPRAAGHAEISGLRPAKRSEPARHNGGFRSQ